MSYIGTLISLFIIGVGIYFTYQIRESYDTLNAALERFEQDLDSKEFSRVYQKFLLAAIGDNFSDQYRILNEAKELIPPERHDEWDQDVIGSWKGSTLTMRAHFWLKER